MVNPSEIVVRVKIMIDVICLVKCATCYLSESSVKACHFFDCVCCPGTIYCFVVVPVRTLLLDCHAWCCYVDIGSNDNTICSPVGTATGHSRDQSKLTARQQTIAELFQTEKNYVGILHTILKVLCSLCSFSNLSHHSASNRLEKKIKYNT